MRILLSLLLLAATVGAANAQSSIVRHHGTITSAHHRFMRRLGRPAAPITSHVLHHRNRPAIHHVTPAPKPPAPEPGGE